MFGTNRDQGDLKLGKEAFESQIVTCVTIVTVFTINYIRES